MKFMDKRAKHLNMANGFDLLMLGFTGFACLQGEGLRPDETWLYSYTCFGVLCYLQSHSAVPWDHTKSGKRMEQWLWRFDGCLTSEMWLRPEREEKRCAMVSGDDHIVMPLLVGVFWTFV